ncbi:MAG: hypothetical protein R3F20_11190 [Planctomycetota bacterium]
MSSKKRWRLRTHYILDAKFQLGWVGVMVGAMLVGCGAVAWFVGRLPDEILARYESPADIRGLVLKLNASYFMLTSGILIGLVIILTHRVSGAAGVIQRAVAGFRRRDFGGRLKLRERDYLQDLAAECSELGRELARREHRQREKMDALFLALDKGELETARELVRGLREPVEA